MTENDYRAVGRDPNGRPNWRVVILSFVGKLLGIHFKVGGWPYGATYKHSFNGRQEFTSLEAEASN